jgi:hypothetical protein
MEYHTMMNENFLKMYKKFTSTGKIPSGVPNSERELFQLLKKGDVTLSPVFQGTQDKELARHFKFNVKTEVLTKLKELVQDSPSFDGFYTKPEDQTP